MAILDVGHIIPNILCWRTEGKYVDGPWTFEW